MIKISNVETWGFEHAIRGMRNPLNSWDKSDSYKNFTVDYDGDAEIHHPYYRVGAADLALMKRLYQGGSEHRKYLRQIMVSLDITAPLYWWKEFDTYKVGTVANSCSTMHKIADKEFTLDDFSHEHLSEDVIENPFKTIIDCLNFFRQLYIQHKDKNDWWQMIQLLPTSYNQKRTITMNYENVITIIKQRSGHKLDEWHTLIDAFKELPFVEEIMGD